MLLLLLPTISWRAACPGASLPRRRLSNCIFPQCRCKRNEVPIEKVFNKSLLGKFLWAMDVEPAYRF